MLNIEKYKDIVLENLNNCHLETSLRGLYGEKVVYCPHTNCGECKDRFLKWLLSEYKEPILNDAEKEYLSAVIKPFKRDVKYICKRLTNRGYYIAIIVNEFDTMNFPFFLHNTMYKGMELDKSYTLKELGL